MLFVSVGFQEVDHNLSQLQSIGYLEGIKDVMYVVKIVDVLRVLTSLLLRVKTEFATQVKQWEKWMTQDKSK